jgi:segregation and condensation protein B
MRSEPAAPEQTEEHGTEAALDGEAAIEDAPTVHAESETTIERAAVTAELAEEPIAPAGESERALLAAVRASFDDVEATVNVAGDMLPFPGRDDLDAPTVTVEGDALGEVDSVLVQRRHLRGLLEALVFASDAPIKPKELAKLASAPVKLVQELLIELKAEFGDRGMHLEEVAGGWVFRTSAQYAPFIRDLTKQRPVRLSRAQVETLAIIAYRQPITRPEVDDVRGVDSGPVLKLLLERDLVRILGKRDEPGRPLIYGTTTQFLEFFGLKSLKDLPTLREFTELTDESREKYEDELGEPPNDARPSEAVASGGTETGTDEEVSADQTEIEGSPVMTEVDGDETHDDETHDDSPPAGSSPGAHDDDDDE